MKFLSIVMAITACFIFVIASGMLLIAGRNQDLNPVSTKDLMDIASTALTGLAVFASSFVLYICSIPFEKK